MHHHRSRNFRIISVVFWAFPYLLWQAFGHWSGFLVGVIVAIILTVMLNGLFWNMASSVRRRSLQITEQPHYQETETYERGYRTEFEPYRAGLYGYPTGEPQAQVLYPEMPLMEQSSKNTEEE